MMSGKRKKKSKSSIKDNRRAAAEVKSNNLELQTWADLPAEVLELFLSRLDVGDNIRASAVCKRWCSVATSLRVVDQSPWLMYFPKKGNCYDFYDPVQRKTYSLELPELDGCRVCYTKDGWLLLNRQDWRRLDGNHIFSLFNPFTRDLITLPKFDRTYQIAAFSCAPTSTGCVILIFRRVGSSLVAISTCYPGEKEWTTVNYDAVLSCSMCDKLVFSNGLFYCLSDRGWLGVFDPLERTWTVLEVPPPKCLAESSTAKNWSKGKFMIEHKGNIFVVYICCGEDPIIFKLDLTLMEWKEVRTLDGVTLFASFLSSHSRTYVTGIMRNGVYFPKVRFYGKRCISFSLDDRRYHPSEQCRDRVEPNTFENFWIEPPKDFIGWM